MSNVPVQQASGAEKHSLPIFAEMQRRLEEIRRRAYELFERRGGEAGHELDDWLAAEADICGALESEFTENDTAYDIRLKLPDFQPEEIEVTAAPEEILVRARSRKEQREETQEGIRTEMSAREVYRRFELQRPTRTDQVTARLENGTLHIYAPVEPRVAAESSRRVTVAVA
jgi:HSP20 family molecular chaperone IbpA